MRCTLSQIPPILTALLALAGLGACAHKLVEDRGSAFALEAGQATMALGGCSRPLRLGYESCQLERGSEMPRLRLAFSGPAEYAVSDCELSIFRQGSVDQAGVVELDLSPISAQIQAAGFCLLKVEALEHYPDPGDPSQRHPIPLAGGFFIETYAPGFLAVPAHQDVAWCYELRRTTKGRTTVEECKP